MTLADRTISLIKNMRGAESLKLNTLNNDRKMEKVLTQRIKTYTKIMIQISRADSAPRIADFRISGDTIQKIIEAELQPENEDAYDNTWAWNNGAVYISLGCFYYACGELR